MNGPRIVHKLFCVEQGGLYQHAPALRLGDATALTVETLAALLEILFVYLAADVIETEGVGGDA